MKRYKIIFSLFVLLFVILVIICYLNKINKKGDHILFEYSHYVAPPAVEEYDYYFALKDNNELIWVYGRGHLGDWTYTSYFTNIKEKGIVKINEEERESLCNHMKKIIKYCEPTESNYCADENEGEEVIIKYNNNYYNKCQTRLKYGYEYALKTSNTEYSFDSLHDELIAIVDKYKDTEIDIYEIPSTPGNNIKVYWYIDNQD